MFKSLLECSASDEVEGQTLHTTRTEPDHVTKNPVSRDVPVREVHISERYGQGVVGAAG